MVVVFSTYTVCQKRYITILGYEQYKQFIKEIPFILQISTISFTPTTNMNISELLYCKM